MLTLPENNKDLGTVKLETPFKFTSPVQNLTGQEMEIIRVQPKCGSCTVASVSQIRIPAGGQIDMKATFTPKSTGGNHKSIVLHYKTSEGKTGTAEFKFKAWVV
jgi:hypothetical protein